MEEDPRLNRKTIDARVKLLVSVLHSIPGVITVSSCGGHKKPGNRLNPSPYGEFYVDFICRNYSSDTTIPLIQKAICPYKDKINDFSRWLEAEEMIQGKMKPGYTVWHLEGTEHPNIIAIAIYKELKKKGFAAT